MIGAQTLIGQYRPVYNRYWPPKRPVLMIDISNAAMHLSHKKGGFDLSQSSPLA
jgi:hypothetical protein